MPWTNRLRESSGLRILSLPPRGVSLLATAYDWTFFPSLSQAKAYPQLALLWLMPRHVLITFPPFLCCDRVVLARSLRYCQVTVEKLKQTGIEVMWHGKRDNEGSHYCAQCEVRCLTTALFSHVIFFTITLQFLDCWLVEGYRPWE